MTVDDLLCRPRISCQRRPHPPDKYGADDSALLSVSCFLPFSSPPRFLCVLRVLPCRSQAFSQKRITVPFLILNFSQVLETCFPWEFPPFFLLHMGRTFLYVYGRELFFSSLSRLYSFPTQAPIFSLSAGLHSLSLPVGNDDLALTVPGPVVLSSLKLPFFPLSAYTLLLTQTPVPLLFLFGNSSGFSLTAI